MKQTFSTKKQWILLGINLVLILLYFVLDIPNMALYSNIPTKPAFYAVFFKLTGIIIPWIVMWFTAPRSNGGYKPTISIYSLFLICFYLYNGNIQIKGSNYIASIQGTASNSGEILANMTISIVLSCLIFISGLGIFYRNKQKKDDSELINLHVDTDAKPIEYIYYDSEGNISETPTTHRVRKF